MVTGGTRRLLAMLAGTALVASVPASGEAQTAPKNSVTLEWTAPGDDGSAGRASAYDLRLSTAPPAGSDSVSLSQWWTQASAATGLPAPSSSGQTDQTQVNNLSYGSTYYFVIVARDEAFNWSGFSNIATATLPPCSAPASAPTSFQGVGDAGTVRLTWASSNDPLADSLHIFRASGPSGGSFALVGSVSPAQGTSYVDGTVTPGASYRYRAAWSAECEGPLGVEVAVTLSGGTAAAAGGSIHAYPNPSSGPVQIVVRVVGSVPQVVNIRLYDLNGHPVSDLANGTYPPGDATLTWPRTSLHGTRVAPGIYQAIGKVGSTRVTERFLLLP